MSVASHRKAKHWGVMALVAVFVLAAVMAQTSLGRSILLKTGLFEQPAKYTSLYFKNPRSVPDQLSKKQHNVDVSFVIHNASGTPQDYQWSVLLLVQGQRTDHVAAGNVHIGSRNGATVTQFASIPCARGQARGPVRIIISLARPAEFIDAVTACPSPGS